jgi:diacylglycerol kinase (ATP)
VEKTEQDTALPIHERGFVESFNASVEGFIYVLKTERNMRIHFLAALFFLLLGIALNFSPFEMITLTMTIALVLATEMINTVVELIVDVIKSEFHPMARIIKDVSAGAVLLVSINAVIVGYILFAKRLPLNIDTTLSGIKGSSWHITFIILILVFGASILGKVIFHRGTPLRGGMPSGHAAIAFSIWTIIVFMSNNTVVITLVFLMAFLIARHRIKGAVHTIWEVVAGAMLGVLLTTMVFQLLR